MEKSPYCISRMRPTGVPFWIFWAQLWPVQPLISVHFYSATLLFIFLCLFYQMDKCDHYLHILLVLPPLHCVAWLKSPINYSCIEPMPSSLLYLYTISITLWCEFSYSVKDLIQNISYPSLLFQNILYVAMYHEMYWSLSQLYILLGFCQVSLSFPCEN